MSENVGVERGAFVVSLDLELYWGVRDFVSNDGGAYRNNLLGVRDVAPRILGLFRDYEVSATWATVGLLFAASAGEAQALAPAILPEYDDPALTPYPELSALDAGNVDPIRFAPDLIRQIHATQGQEIGTHTFSHFYCLETGQTKAAFRADLERAMEVSEAAGFGRIRSIVFPRNQWNEDYASVLDELGIVCCRTTARGWFNREMAGDRYFRPHIRIARLLDSYLPVSGSQVIKWRDLRRVNGVCCLPASHYVRSFSPRLRWFESLKLRRIRADLDRAAASSGIVHVWWHPENFGQHSNENLALLERLLDAFAERREQHGLESLTMAEVGERVRRIERSNANASYPPKRVFAPKTQTIMSFHRRNRPARVSLAEMGV